MTPQLRARPTLQFRARTTLRTMPRRMPPWDGCASRVRDVGFRSKLQSSRLASGTCVLAVGLLFLLLAAGAGTARTLATERKVERPAAVVVRPRADQKVERREILRAKAIQRGWPIVLVSPDEPTREWWVQQLPQRAEPGQFTCEVHFGNDETLVGTRFLVVVLMTPTTGEALRFHVGQMLDELPDLPRSDIVTVERKTGVPAELDVTLDTPRAGGRVERDGRLSGRLPFPCQPVLLARPVAPGAVWRVQAKAEVSEDLAFQVPFGFDPKATSGRHRLVLVLTSAEQSRGYTVGATLKEPPRAIHRSRELEVQLAK